MGFFRAYFDASKSSATLGVLAVGGYWAYSEAWDTWFDGRWQNLLADFGLEYFHMTDFENNQGPYKSWTRERHQDFLVKALDIIHGTVRVGIGVALDLKAFDARRKDWNRLGVRSPYHLCAQWCAVVMLQWIDTRFPGNDTIWMFEDGDFGKGDLQVGLKDLSTRYSPVFRKLSKTAFGDKVEVPPLQAADYLAYETHKAALRALKRDHRPDRKSLMASLEAGPAYDSALMDEAFLDKMLADMERAAILLSRSEPSAP